MNDLQMPNQPVDINWESPEALKQIIEQSRQTLQKLNEHEQRLSEMEKIVLE